jgi:hypothetical protein
MKTQNDRLEAYLKAYGSITPLEALRDLGIMRLGARIYDLEHNGMAGRIVHGTAEVKNRWGQTCRVARYVLVNEGQQVLAI